MQLLLINILAIRRIMGLLPVIATLLCGVAHAQARGDTLQAPVDSTVVTTGSPNSESGDITSFDKFDMPVEMINSFVHLAPKGVLLYHDEFQSTRDGVNGLEIMVVKVWYIDDHIIGYVIHTPLEKAGAAIKKSKIDIPVTWACVPAIQGHDEHQVHSLAELRNDETNYKCTGWHILLPEPAPQPVVRLQKLKPGKRLQPQAGDFGHAEKTSDKPKSSKKKKGKQQGFEQVEDTVPAVDSTQVPKQP